MKWTYAVVGSGSIGLYYGAKLTRSGVPVKFLMRSGLEDARRCGIRVQGEEEQFVVRDSMVFASPEEMAPVDVVVLALKSTSNDLIDHLVGPLFGQSTRILTLQNGLGGTEMLASKFGPHRIYGGLCFVCLTRDAPASVQHLGHGTITLGAYKKEPNDDLRRLAGDFQGAGVETQIADSLEEAQWRKLTWNIAFNGLSIARGAVSVDQLLQNPETHAELCALMNETLSIASALGHEMDPGIIEFHLKRTRAMGEYRPSSLIDYLAGRKIELETIWGNPMRAAVRAGVRAPHLAALYEELRSITAWH